MFGVYPAKGLARLHETPCSIAQAVAEQEMYDEPSLQRN